MKICDLGEIRGDMLLFGGIYSNLAALDAFLKQAENIGIAPQNCICTGDVVAYCADAQSCVNRLRDFGCPVLAGNCEVQLAANAPDCGCGFDADSTCSLLSHGWYAHARSQVSDENKRWMGDLPDRIIFSHNGQRYAVVHGGASDISHFIWPVTDDARIAAEIDMLIGQVGQVDHVISGHSGIPMHRRINGVAWTNTGAIGMPAHNGSPMTYFGYLSEKDISINKLSYDIDVTIKAMQLAGLTQGYDKTLQSGYWPSEDNLPIEMRCP